jgi:hypothetical protein
MCQRNDEEVPQSLFKLNRELDTESFFVNGLIHKLVDNTLWNTLRLAHHLFLKEDLLPIELHLALVIKHVIIIRLNIINLVFIVSLSFFEFSCDGYNSESLVIIFA